MKDGQPAATRLILKCSCEVLALSPFQLLPLSNPRSLSLIHLSLSGPFGFDLAKGIISIVLSPFRKTPEKGNHILDRGIHEIEAEVFLT